MTVRHAVLPVAAVLVLGVGVYLFVQVRAEPAPPPVPTARPSRPAAAEARVQPPLAQPNAAPPSTARPSAPVHPPDPAGPAPPAPREGTSPTLDADATLTGAKLDAVMDEANKAYDRGEFEDAKVIAGRVLAREPANVRMLRIMVSASCIDGDSAVAQAHYSKLPARDQEQMRIRCARYGITFVDRP